MRTAAVAAVAVTVATGAVLLRGPHGTAGPNLLLLLVAYVALAVILGTEVGRHRAGTPSGLSKTLVFACSAGLLVLAVIVPPTESGDVRAYEWYGRVVARYHASPYRHPAASHPDDPWARRVDPIYQHTRSVYGPVFTAVSGAGMFVFGWTYLTARLFFQLLAALCVAAAMVVVWRRARSPAALAAIGLNPLVIVSVVNGGHNDAWVGLAVLGGVLLVMRGRYGWAGVALAAAALVKIAAVLPLAAVGLWVLRRRGWRPTLAMGGWALGAGVVGYAVFAGSAAIDALRAAQLHMSGASVWFGPRRWMTLAAVRHGLTGSAAGHVVRARISWAATGAVAALTLLLVGRRLGHSNPAIVAGGSVLAYTLLGAYVLPWYVFWGLPPLALAWRSRLTWLALAHGAVLHIAYVPDPALHEGPLDPLRILTPLQRLQLDLYQVWVPLVEVVIIAVVIAMSLRRPTRRSMATT